MRVSVYDFLRQSILDGTYRPGDKLPSTRALARQLSVSRTTVVDTFERLAVEGLVEARAGSGTKVAGCPVRAFFRRAHYPAQVRAFRDHEGMPIYLHS